MNPPTPVDSAIAQLSAGSTIRCNQMVKLLDRLGFTVRSGKNPSHKIITHARLDAFTSKGFDCGHGKNPQLKPAYVTSMRNMLKMYADDLKELLGVET